MGSDWASLPRHLLDCIVEGLESLQDYLQFSVVCHSWHSIAKDNQSKRLKYLGNHYIPFLLVPSKGRISRTWNMYSVLDNKFLESKMLLPWHRRRFCGSSEGWLATINERLAITLHKTFIVNDKKSDAIIRLPSLLPPGHEEEAIYLNSTRYLEEYILKFTTFTPDPIANPKDLICVAICGAFLELAYIRPTRNSKWTHVTSDLRLLGFDDVIPYNGQFYAITCNNKVATFNVTEPDKSNLKLVTTNIPKSKEKKYYCYKRYMVESCGGKLWQVRRYADKDAPNSDFDPVTKKFKVFKLCLDRPRWIEIKNLGDVALFLGDNSSISIVASKHGCKRNCIYFTQDKNTLPLGCRGPWDFGVYDLKSESLLPRFNIDSTTVARMRQAPIWVVPALNTY